MSTKSVPTVRAEMQREPSQTVSRYTVPILVTLSFSTKSLCGESTKQKLTCKMDDQTEENHSPRYLDSSRPHGFETQSVSHPAERCRN
ncbi:hypothetical protein RRG08_061367 [Elysia crispata]|uniref:Uncharacterized protein n=1 Tax=Elysia crispata TaxID=231223 RepID=A0AAE1AGG0_9GAST|nr:hypothetical protein RRG08_061367 [Elysia crispata]